VKAVTEHDVVERLKSVPTAAVSDALDALGIRGQFLGIAPLTREFRIVGPAFTVRYEPAGTTRGTVGDFLDDVPAGAVVTIENGGRLDATVWGGIMTRIAAAKGIGGTLIDGVCRDVTTSLTRSYPLFTRGAYMHTGKDRVNLVAVNEPVAISGIPVRPGDLVCGDADGALAVPAERAAEVVALAERIEAVEQQIVTAVEQGSTLRQARTVFSYHDLQAKP
jgi:regulator of RNase E activity RraA